MNSIDPVQEHPKSEPARLSRLLCHLLTDALAVVFAALLICHGLLDTAPEPRDEAQLLTLPTRLVQVATESDLQELVSTYYESDQTMPPVSLIGTALSMRVFGVDAVGQSVDNLLIALLAAFFAARFLDHFIDRTLAPALAACLLVAPFALQFARVELVELYLWAVTLVFFYYVLLRQPLRSKLGTVGLGVLGGIGIGTKLSFPLVVAPLALWHLVAELRAAGAGGRGSVLWRALGSLVIGALVVAALCGKNWQHMWRHLLAQSGWVGDQPGGIPDRLSIEFFERYLLQWTEYVGWLWLGLAGLALLGGVIALIRRHAAEPPTRPAPVAALVFIVLVNLGCCYFFPVIDMHDTLGAIAALVLLVGIGLGAATRGKPRLAACLGIALLAVSGVSLLSNSFVPASEGWPVLKLDAPVVGRMATALPAPCQDSDLRRPALRAAGVLVQSSGRSYRIGLAGEHRSLNLDNLRLFVQRQDLDLSFVQIGDLGPDLSLADRLAKAGKVDAWVVCVDPDQSNQQIGRFLGAPAHLVLSGDPGFEQAKWQGRFADGVTVSVFRRPGE